MHTCTECGKPIFAAPSPSQVYVRYVWSHWNRRANRNHVAVPSGDHS